MSKALILLTMVVLLSSCKTAVAPKGELGGDPPSEIYPASTYGTYGSASLYHKGALCYLYTKLANIPSTYYPDSSNASCIAKDRVILHQYFVDSMGLTGSTLTQADSSLDSGLNNPVYQNETTLLALIAGMSLSARERSFINRCIAVDSTPEYILPIMGKLDSINAIYSNWQAVTGWDSIEGYDGHLSEGFIWITGSSIDFWDEMDNYYPAAPTRANPGMGGAVVQSIEHSGGSGHSPLRPTALNPWLALFSDALGYIQSSHNGGTPSQNAGAMMGASVGSLFGGYGGALLGFCIGLNNGGIGDGRGDPSPGDRDATWTCQ